MAEQDMRGHYRSDEATSDGPWRMVGFLGLLLGGGYLIVRSHKQDAGERLFKELAARPVSPKKMTWAEREAYWRAFRSKRGED